MPDPDSSLNDAIAEALAVGKADPNINEACTCEWIVKPLLQAAGYRLYDIQPQAMDTAGKVPDFTILPNTEQAWFVEAKAWKVALNDQHAQQALIYAFASSRRWVVLTNGREWRLYDNSIQGQHLRQKQVASAMLEDVDRAAEFLRAIGRESMTGGAVERYASDAQLSAVLEKELANPAGDIIKAIWSRLRTRPGLAGITKEQVAGYFGGPQPTPPEPKPVVSKTGRSYGLDELLGRAEELITFRRPVTLFLPDGSTVDTPTWKDVAASAIKWLGEKGQLPPLPWVHGSSRHRYFLSREPKHPDADATHEFLEIATPNGPVFMDKKRSGADLMRQVRATSSGKGGDHSSLAVGLQEP